MEDAKEPGRQVGDAAERVEDLMRRRQRDRDRVDGEITAAEVLSDRGRRDVGQRPGVRVALGAGPGDVGGTAVAERDDGGFEAVVAPGGQPEGGEDRFEVALDGDVDVGVGT